VQKTPILVYVIIFMPFLYRRIKKIANFDIQLKLVHCYDLFEYDIHCDVDVPLVLPNWDERKVFSTSLDRIERNNTISNEPKTRLANTNEFSFFKKPKVFCNYRNVIG